MRIVFVGLGQEQLGLSVLSAVLRHHGHETALVFEPALFDDRYYFEIPALARVFARGIAAVADEIAALQPDLVAFGALTTTYQWSLSVARAVKERRDVPVVFGGVHASAVPELCLEEPAIDFVCIGEGEHALLALCDALARGERPPRSPLANLAWRDRAGAVVRGPNAPFLQDLDALPHFDKELWEDAVDVGARYLTMTSRGCPYRCTFCFNNYFARLPGSGGGKYVRQRSVAHVLDELTRARDRYRLRYVELTDDVFTVDREFVRGFCARYAREIAVPFQCLVHPRFIDEEVARWLRDAGCVHVQMGVQSADEAYKREKLLRMERDADVHRALEALERARLPVKLDHMLGLPGEPASAQEEARRLYARFALRRIQIFWLSYLPGVEMTREAHASGVLSTAELDAINRGETNLFRRPHDLAASGMASASAPELTDPAFFQRYELLFQLHPLLPAALRQRLRAEHLPALRGPAAKALGLSLDLAGALKALDAEALSYGRHYAHQLAAHAAARLGRRRTPRVLPPLASADAARPARAPVRAAAASR